jgi:hypothetical protein
MSDNEEAVNEEAVNEIREAVWEFAKENDRVENEQVELNDLIVENQNNRKKLEDMRKELHKKIDDNNVSWKAFLVSIPIDLENEIKSSVYGEAMRVQPHLGEQVRDMLHVVEEYISSKRCLDAHSKTMPEEVIKYLRSLSKNDLDPALGELPHSALCDLVKASVQDDEHVQTGDPEKNVNESNGTVNVSDKAKDNTGEDPDSKIELSDMQEYGDKGEGHYNDGTAYDRVWTTIFDTVKLADVLSVEDVTLVLFGADLSSDSEAISPKPHWVLAVDDKKKSIAAQNLEPCLRSTLENPGEYQLDIVNLTYDSSLGPELFGQDFGYLFRPNGEWNLTTQYCYWNDDKKHIKTLNGTDICGIGGGITEAEELAPIFSVNLKLDNSSMQKYIFKNFGGNPNQDTVLDLVEAQYTEEGNFTGFKFIQDTFKLFHGQKVDWNKIAGQKDRVVRT